MHPMHMPFQERLVFPLLQHCLNFSNNLQDKETFFWASSTPSWKLKKGWEAVQLVAGAGKPMKRFLTFIYRSQISAAAWPI